MDEQLKKTNPWNELTMGDVKIATCDIPFFEKWAKKNSIEGSSYEEWVNAYARKNEKVQLSFKCQPDPFGGNPDSKVYCLNLNPGTPNEDFEGNAEYVAASNKNLHLEANNCFWTENIKINGKPHPGDTWLRTCTKGLQDSLKNPHPDIFFIEYFPYHSTNGFYFPKHLPSYDFSDKLIKQAMKDKKIIIILRGRRRWLDRIPELAKYEHLYVLLINRDIKIAPEYIVPYKPMSEGEIKKYFTI